MPVFARAGRIMRARPLPVSWLAAGAAYTLATYAFAFGVGALRVLLVAPRVGPTLAVLLEAPIVLAAAWQLARWSLRAFAVADDLAVRLAMAAFSFALLMTLEAAVGAVAFGQSLAAQVRAFKSAAGIIGLAAQLCFACIPLAQRRGGRA
jgi:hypothetical protein